MATAAFAAPQGTFDTSEIQITGEASRSVAPNLLIKSLMMRSLLDFAALILVFSLVIPSVKIA